MAVGALAINPCLAAGNAAKGKTLYSQTGCAPCHGASGRGDGSVSKSLDPRPMNLSNGKAMSKITDATLEKVIRRGGKSVGKSALMPAVRGPVVRVADPRCCRVHPHSEHGP